MHSLKVNVAVSAFSVLCVRIRAAHSWWGSIMATVFDMEVLMTRPIFFLLRLPVAVVILAVATLGLVAISVPSTDAQRTSFASVIVEALREMTSE